MTPRLPSGIVAGSKIENPVTMQRYRLVKRLGSGGFGDAFSAVEEGGTGPDVCLKITSHAETWHGEAFLGSFLRGSARAVQVLDAFPFTWVSGRERKRRRTLFAVVSELMTAGTVADWCARSERGWPEKQVRREIRLLLDTLEHLHHSGVSHRDITPQNVFLASRSRLKLGDFGIAAMARPVRGAPADAYNPAFKPPNVNTYWTPADDIYQVGLLAMTLLKGEIVMTGVRKPQLNPLTAQDPTLRAALKKALDSNRALRYGSASQMALDLR